MKLPSAANGGGALDVAVNHARPIRRFGARASSALRQIIACALLLCLPCWAASVSAQETERQYLSGHGPKDALPWQFTVTGGRRSGEKTTIPVPSHWEQHGFGSYNYGEAQTNYNGGAQTKPNEHGLYSLRFKVPPQWAQRRVRLVFAGVMTDAKVTVNGQPAGPVHQGGFNEFRFDVSALLKFDAENLLEVDVSKVSANALTERAERGGDYWVFGGIYRPVWLEATPPQSIEQVAIDARADGSLTADIVFGWIFDKSRPDGPTQPPEDVEAQILDAAGKPVGAAFGAKIPAGGTGRLRIATRAAGPLLWTAETPNLYTLRVTRRRGGAAVHTVNTRFGFRSFEVRDGVGLFLNGQRILLKGVNRHSFRPATGRSLDREDAYTDVRLIRSMNMNAVRMSHYAPDAAFLEACDELGLYVLDELSGWQNSHDTAVGRLLVRELVERDVNHPSIVFWDNGNEGGWNRDLDGDFALYDPQARRVLHPWDPFGGIDTKHYTGFSDHARRLRGPNLVMPTEILHGLYDGGMGAGLDDYWRAITDSPFGAGAFLWDLADEGIVRTDQGGRVDVNSTFAPDGLVGPRFEKEGSYFAVREIWSPVQAKAPVLDEKFTGAVAIENRYDFTSLARTRFAWRWLSFERGERVLAQGIVAGPELAPHARGTLSLPLPPGWRDADALALTAADPTGEALWTWTWATPRLAERTATAFNPASSGRPRLIQAPDRLEISAGAVTARFDPHTGTLLELRRGAKSFALGQGPRLSYARPPVANAVTWIDTRVERGRSEETRLLNAPQLANVVEVELDLPAGTPYGGMKLELSPDGRRWKTVYDGTRRPGDGARYDFPPQTVSALRISKARRNNGEPVTTKAVRVGYEAARFPPPPPAETPQISSGEGPDATGKASVAWIEVHAANGLDHFRWTLDGAGALRLDYEYALSGDFVYHGISFDHPEEAMKSLIWLGEGPYRVWQNRQQGTWLSMHQVARDDQQPGEAWQYPEFQGYRRGVRWAQLDTATGPLRFTLAAPDTYLRIGTPRISHPQTTAEFPAGDISFLHAIAGMGSKFKPPADSGPSALPAKANGQYRGSVLFEVP